MRRPSNIVFRSRARKEDFRELKNRLREQDQVEILAYSGPTYERLDKVIEDTHSNTPEPWALIDRQGQLVALYGIGNTARSDIGLAWFLGTDRVRELGQSIAFISRIEIQSLVCKRLMLYNYIYSDNRITRQWLKHMGFVEMASFPRLGHFGNGFTLVCYFSKPSIRIAFIEWASNYPRKLGRLRRYLDEIDLDGCSVTNTIRAHETDICRTLRCRTGR